MRTVALNSAAAIKQFQRTAGMMNTVDYNLSEIVGDVIMYLHDGNNMSNVVNFCVNAMFTRRPDLTVSEDGVIMARAIREITEALKLCFLQMKMYDADNKLNYRLQSIVSHTVIVEATK